MSAQPIKLRPPERVDAILEQGHVSGLIPSPENDLLYRPIDPADPDFIALVESIRRHGVREPITIASDGHIISGHRRHAAAIKAGVEVVPCRVLEQIRRKDYTDDEWIELLREHNRQRVKSLDEMLREEIVSSDPDEAFVSMVEQRDQKPAMSSFQRIRINHGRRKRSKISPASRPMLNACLAIVKENRRYWPLSDRSIHYLLLNDPPLKHASKPDSTYSNTQADFKGKLCDLLLRARLFGLIPWEAITDETRPITIAATYPNPQAFIRDQLAGFMKNYWRSYQQSQPNHIEIIAEKLTVKNIVEPIALKFGIPLTIGRGYSSGPPRQDMAERFEKSGKDRLVVLALTDFDPDGENIAESFATSMKLDFDIDGIGAYKVALTAKQVRDLKLVPRMKAKKGASTYKKFVEKHGDNVFELEAVAPEKLQALLTKAIDGVMDRDLFNAELRAEHQDAAFLDQARQRAARALQGIEEGRE